MLHDCVPFPKATNASYAGNFIVRDVDDPPGAGKGLFLCKDMKRGDIVGIYENFTGGPRLTGRRIKDNAHVSDYAVEFEGLVKDAWDPVAGRPCHHLRFTNDALDMARDNMTFFIHRLRPTALLVVMTKDTPAGLQGFNPYGGPYWCHDMYPLATQIQAVRRYGIDVRTSTADNDGDWTKLTNYAAIAAACPCAMTEIRTKKRPTPNCDDNLGEARSDSTGAIKWQRTGTAEDDDEDEPLLLEATCQTTRKTKRPQLEPTDSLQVAQDDGSVTMKWRRTLMDYYRHKEEPLLIGTMTAEELEDGGSASAAGVDSVANDSSDVMLLCDETTLVNPECHAVRAKPVDRHLEMDGAVTAMELGPLSSVLDHDKGIEFR